MVLCKYFKKIILISLYLVEGLAWCDWPFILWTDQLFSFSALTLLVGSSDRKKIVPDMTYNVFGGTLNPTLLLLVLCQAEMGRTVKWWRFPTSVSRWPRRWAPAAVCRLVAEPARWRSWIQRTAVERTTHGKCSLGRGEGLRSEWLDETAATQRETGTVSCWELILCWFSVWPDFFDRSASPKWAHSWTDTLTIKTNSSTSPTDLLDYWRRHTQCNKLAMFAQDLLSAQSSQASQGGAIA